jgi:hypothetical protein
MKNKTPHPDPFGKELAQNSLLNPFAPSVTYSRSTMFAKPKDSIGEHHQVDPVNTPTRVKK